MWSGELIVILGVVAVVLGLAWMWRSAESRAGQATAEKEAVVAEREELRARLARESQSRKKQSEELAAQRKRADKAKRRKTKGTPDLPLGTASRIADFEAQIERAERERDQSRAEREQLSGRVAQLEASLEVKARAAKEAELAGRSTPAPVAVVSDVPGLEAAQVELSESRKRIGALEDELRAAREAETRMRKRVSNQEQLYASIRAELEVKKDRLRTQEEQIQRLQALKVVVAD
jgi:Sec-independent protein translocase protein TatA